MLYVLLIYEKPDDFARRESAVESEAYAGAWRAYHRALLDAGIFVGGKPLDAPETATTVRLRDSKRTAAPCLNASKRMPSSLRSKTQSGPLKRSRVSVAAMGSSQSGRAPPLMPPI